MKKVPRIRRLATLALLTGVAALLGSSPARADEELYLSDGVHSILIDGTTSSVISNVGVTVGSISYLPSGTIAFNGSMGTWNINVTTGLSKPATGSATAPSMDLNSINHTTAAGTLTIRLADTEFGPAGGFTQSIGGTMGAGWHLTATAIADPTNGQVPAPGVSTVLTFSSSPYSGTSSTPGVNYANPFSLSLTDVITAAGAGTISFDHELVGAPEPGTMAMVATSLPILGLIWARRRKAKAQS